MSGGSKKVTVGYRYRIGLHGVLCVGPISRITEISFDDRLAWSGGATDTTITINDPELFGGESREGGVSGDIDVLMGGSTQTPNTYLQDQIQADIPAYRGVVSLIFKNFYMGLNPYFKKIKIRAQNLLDVNDPTFESGSWNTNLVEIESGSEGNAALAGSIPVTAADLDFTHQTVTGWNPTPSDIWVINNAAGTIETNLTSNQHLGTSLLSFDFDAMLPAGTFPTRITVDTELTDYNGPEFYIQIRVADTIFRPIGRRNTSVSPLARPEHTYGDGLPTVTGDSVKQITTAPLVLETWTYIVEWDSVGLQTRYALEEADGTVLWEHLRAANGTVTDGNYIQHVGGAVREFALDHVAMGSGAGSSGVNHGNTFSNISIDYESPTTGGAPAVTEYNGRARAIDVNPAHIIRETLVNKVFGMGYPVSDIDDASFTNAATQLLAEGMGMSYKWSTQTPVEEFINDVLRHIDAALYIDRYTGLFALRLIRGDYNEANLPTLEFGVNIVSVNDYKRIEPVDATNSVTVTYWDSITGKDASVKVDNIALIQRTGVEVNNAVRYDGFTSKRLATLAAYRELTALSTPLLSAVLICNREASDLQIGDPFKFVYADEHEDFVIMRVTKIQLGDGNSNVVRITAVEDVYSFATEFNLGNEDAGGFIEGATLSESPNVAVREAPYYEIAQRFGDTQAQDIFSNDPTVGFTAVTAEKPFGHLNAQVHVDDGSGFTNAGVMDFAPTVHTASPVGQGDTIINVKNPVDLSLVELGTHVLLLEELMRIDNIDLTDPDLPILTVGRGCLDTVPRAYGADEVMFFWDDEAFSDEVQYNQGETIGTKVLPSTGGQTLSIANATTKSFTMAARGIRPYVAQNVKFNGVAYPTSVVSGDVAVTWSHRDRLQQTSTTLDDTTAGDIGPEAGTTYNLTIYNENFNVLRTETGLTGNGYTYLQTDEAADTAAIGGTTNDVLRFVLLAERDGHTSHQGHLIAIQRV